MIKLDNKTSCYQYEVAGDDDSGGGLSRVGHGIRVNSIGTLISDVPLPYVDDNVLWLQECVFE